MRAHKLWSLCRLLFWLEGLTQTSMSPRCAPAVISKTLRRSIYMNKWQKYCFPSANLFGPVGHISTLRALQFVKTIFGFCRTDHLIAKKRSECIPLSTLNRVGIRTSLAFYPLAFAGIQNQRSIGGSFKAKSIFWRYVHAFLAILTPHIQTFITYQCH